MGTGRNRHRCQRGDKQLNCLSDNEKGSLTRGKHAATPTERNRAGKESRTMAR